MLTRLKQEVQALLTKEAIVAHRIGLTPNGITVIGVILAFLSAFTYAEWSGQPTYLFLAAALLLFSGFSDALDGVVARLYQQTTIFGGFFDSLLDRYADAFVFVGLILGGLCDLLMGLIALTGSFLVSYARARAEAASIKMESIGFAERAERIAILMTASFVAVFWQPYIVMTIAVILLAVSTNLTVLQRGIYAYRMMKRKTET